MAESRETFLNLVKNAPFGVFIIDREFRLIEISAGAQRIFESVEPAIGRDFDALSQLIWREPFATEFVERLRQTLATGESYQARNAIARRRDTGDFESYDLKLDRMTLFDGAESVVCYFHDPASRRASANGSGKSNGLSSGVLDSMPSHIAVLNNQGTIVAVNEAWRRFAVDNAGEQTTILEKTGVGVNYLETCRMSKGLFSDEAAAAYDGIKSVLGGRSGYFAIEYPCHSPVEERWFHLNCTPLQSDWGSAVVTHTNITSHKLAEKKLRDSEENYRDLFENNPVPMWVYDLETLRFLEVNDAAVDYYGYSREEFLAMTIKDIRPPEDVAALLAIVSSPRKSLNLAGIWRHRKKDGALINVEISSHILDFNGRTARLMMANDVTERSRAEENLRRSEARYRLLFEDNPSPMVIYDFTTLKFLDVNEATCLHYGYTREEFLAMTLADIADPEDVREIRQKVRQNRDGRTFYGAWKHRKKDGSEIWVETASHRLDIEGENSRLVLISDVTDKKRAADALREAEKRFRATFEHAAVGIAHIAPDGKWLLANERLCEMTGYTREELAEKTFHDILHPDDRDHGIELFRKILKGEIETYTKEKRYVRKDGTVIWINKTVSLVRDTAGAPQYFISVIEDVSQRKAAEEELRKWAAAFENCAHGIALGDPRTNRIIAVNAAFAQLCGKSKDEIEDQPILSIYEPDFHDVVRETVVTADREGTAHHNSLIKGADGKLFPVQVDLVSVRDESGEVAYRVGTIQDISARKEAEDALRESEAKLRLFVEFAPAAVAMFDREMKYLAVSRRWLQDLGIEGDVLGRSHYEIFPEITDRWKQIHRSVLAGAVEKSDEDQFVRADGTIQWLKWEVRPWFNSANEIGGIIIFSEDITERKKAEEELRKSEEKLRQSQKMEAVGRLAGGIAHDFNNMLTVIKGYGDLGLRLLPKDSPVRNYVEEIKKAGDRSSSLTHQLLAFSRTQIVQPEKLNLNQAVAETLKMLKYVIGEDIRLVLELLPETLAIKADPGHISQVLMNLLVNARDAMPDGGTITIKTDKIFLKADDLPQTYEKAGSYARLELGDTGIGMDEETLRKIFEPFYTTKSVGKGTGLG
ncbi:MAG: PAS domain S-box protein, partial [Acidobacteria bacterium]|nr:PAS domain S-box protein [Acidobacteriota bacterium]